MQGGYRHRETTRAVAVASPPKFTSQAWGAQSEPVEREVGVSSLLLGYEGER